jgi:hypothetical protein
MQGRLKALSENGRNGGAENWVIVLISFVFVAASIVIVLNLNFDCSSANAFLLQNVNLYSSNYKHLDLRMLILHI